MKKIIFSGGFVGRGFRLPDIRKNLLLWSMLASLFAGVAAGAFHGRNADAEMLPFFVIAFVMISTSLELLSLFVRHSE